MNMTNLEISRRLALAIGYAQEDVKTDEYGFVFVQRVNPKGDWEWWRFDHEHADTIYPIAEHFKMMPVWNTQYKQWTIAKVAPRGSMPSVVLNDDPRTCIALAVIEAAERGLLK
jgi:hypothetical protein